ncbi:hypothetical protein CYMTET_38845 [Cymbomonas tetramitiformis]|uniref:Uncharacterized protein n=1 Tax=Cymbomonas tetramitiformis TaxID=36881 RepID=A0AAE0CB79_9CHLO|nr:hypothetical protein CYMTET_38845 [Cymbomonas tetramitiformis]
MRVTLADGSVKTTGSVAYSKFTARTTTGTYSESSMAMRVLPLGIAVDMVLGGKWLRSLSLSLKDGLEETQRMEEASTISTTRRQLGKSVRFQTESSPGRRVRQAVFDRIQAKYGNFNVDACCDEQGNDRQEWRLDPGNTYAVFLLPNIQARMPRRRSLFRRAGMRIEEVIPTHDAQFEPVQLMEGPNGKLVDLQQPMLVVYAPPSKQRVQRIRHTRTPVPIVLKGKSAKLRDSEENATDAVFMEALKSEYDRDGSLHDAMTYGTRRRTLLIAVRRTFVWCG